MKYIKNFQIDINVPVVGDYVICDEDVVDIEYKNFLKNNIGQINSLDEVSKLYNVEYSYIPENFNIRFRHNCRGFYPSEIKHWTKNKEDLDMYLDIKKYNL